MPLTPLNPRTQNKAGPDELEAPIESRLLVIEACAGGPLLVARQAAGVQQCY